MLRKSPFPGMDPYLERHWGDVHHSLIQYSRDMLQEQLPGSLRARVEERIFLESDEGWKRTIIPDVHVVEQRRPGEPAPRSSAEQENGGVAVAEPLEIIVPNEPLTEGFIQIIDTATGNKVITIIEFLSLANKITARGAEEYIRKQKEVLQTDISLVEIDLLRAGPHVTAVPAESIPPSHQTPYHVSVHRAWAGPKFQFYAIPLRQRLPTIKIPLRQTDPDATLNLQALIDQAWRMGRYDDLDYSRPLTPPLNPEDAQWATELIRKASSAD